MRATIHANSLAAYHDGELGAFTKRQREILGVLGGTGPKITDRTCMKLLGYTDMNAVRPRITELIKKGVLRESGQISCPETKKKVRQFSIAPLDNGDYLPGFNTGGIAMTDEQINRREAQK